MTLFSIHHFLRPEILIVQISEDLSVLLLQFWRSPEILTKWKIFKKCFTEPCLMIAMLHYIIRWFQVTILTFAVFTLSSSSNVLTPEVAFVSLTLFNQLRSPMALIAFLMKQTVEVSLTLLQLIQHFLNANSKFSMIVGQKLHLALSFIF